MTVAERSGGAVYDRGYRPYAGPLGGRRAARWALVRASMRRAVGLRRSWRQKVFPWLLLAIASVPAVVWVGVAYITRDTPADAIEIITYREYVGVSTALLVFVGFAAPDVLCPDRRNNTLPLLFARPLTGTDYVIAKVGAIGGLLFAFTFLPQVILFVGQMLVSDGALGYLTDNADVLWKVTLASAQFSLYYAVLSCAIASLTTRRLIAAAALLILLLGSAAFAGGLSEAAGAPERQDDFTVELDADEAQVLGDDQDELPPGVFVADDPSSVWGALDLLSTPMYVRDLIFEGEVLEPYLAGTDGAGPLALGVWALVVAASTGILLWRYRWMEP